MSQREIPHSVVQPVTLEPRIYWNTGLGSKVGLKLRESIREVEAEVESSSRIKITKPGAYLADHPYIGIS